MYFQVKNSGGTGSGRLAGFVTTDAKIEHVGCDDNPARQQGAWAFNFSAGKIVHGDETVAVGKCTVLGVELNHGTVRFWKDGVRLSYSSAIPASAPVQPFLYQCCPGTFETDTFRVSP